MRVEREGARDTSADLWAQRGLCGVIKLGFACMIALGRLLPHLCARQEAPRCRTNAAGVRLRGMQANAAG